MSINLCCIHELSKCIYRLIHLSVTLILCLTFSTTCTITSDPAFEIIKQALQNEDTDPAATYEALKDNLDAVKDKRVIELLLDYLDEKRYDQPVYPAILGEIAFYLERVSGIKSHISPTFGGPLYLAAQDWIKDIAQWQSWWDTNKDYIVWDKQSGALKVRRP